MAKKNWIVNLDDCEHRIELEHGHISGKRIIYLDGNVIERINHNISDAGSNHKFKINEHICVVLIKVVFKFSYDLIIDVNYVINENIIITNIKENNNAKCVYIYNHNWNFRSCDGWYCTSTV